ncbi:glycosyltransferase family 4 protein [Cohnella lupini]|nr:glycosyltransferase family 4 protein [Cohnella lupini]
MKIAVIHDRLVVYAGAEKVLEQILKVYPEADLFSLVDFLPDNQRDFLQQKKSKTSFIQRLPFSRKKHLSYLPFMPIAIEQFDLSKYDLVISSSYIAAKGVITGPTQLHISYVYTPIRYAWEMQHQYLKDFGKSRGLSSIFIRMVLHYIRNWDVRSTNGVDVIVTSSKFIRNRITKTYRRDSEIIYPPVDVEGFKYNEIKEEYYFTASRLVPYKRIDLIVEAFRQLPDKKLIIIGEGPEAGKLKSKLTSNIEFLGYQSTEVLQQYMQKAKAFVFAAEEDFGIVPVEAQACGTPVIAFGKGGALETVIPLGEDLPTGIFFYEQTANSLLAAIKQFENNYKSFNAANCRNNALRFSEERFRNEFKALVDRNLKFR